MELDWLSLLEMWSLYFNSLFINNYFMKLFYNISTNYSKMKRFFIWILIINHKDSITKPTWTDYVNYLDGLT